MLLPCERPVCTLTLTTRSIYCHARYGHKRARKDLLPLKFLTVPLSSSQSSYYCSLDVGLYIQYSNRVCHAYNVT